jgi:hypothetical protein
MRATLSLLFLSIMPVFTAAQTIVENPAKPDNPRAGRVVTLEEVISSRPNDSSFPAALSTSTTGPKTTWPSSESAE